MAKTSKTQRRLALSSTASLIVLAATLAASGPAAAQCAPDPVANGGVVTCTGTDTNGLQTTSTGVAVTVANGATVSGAALFDGPFELGNNATLVNNGTINANLASRAIDANAGATLTNNGAILAPRGDGVLLRGGSFVNSVTGSIDIVSRPNSGTLGVRVLNGGSIRNEGTVSVSGDNVAKVLLATTARRCSTARALWSPCPGSSARALSGLTKWRAVATASPTQARCA